MNEQFYIALLGFLFVNVLIWLWIDSKLDKILHEINPTKYKSNDLREVMNEMECMAKQKPQVRYNAPNEYDAVKDFSLKYLVEPLEGALGHDMVKTNSNNCQIIEIIELTDRPYDIEIKVKGKGVKDDT